MIDIKKTSLKILNWFKKHKVVALILSFLLLCCSVGYINNVYNSISVGGFIYFAKYPDTKFFEPGIQEINKIKKRDDNNLLFFMDGGDVYNFNIKERKFNRQEKEVERKKNSKIDIDMFPSQNGNAHERRNMLGMMNDGCYVFSRNQKTGVHGGDNWFIDIFDSKNAKITSLMLEFRTFEPKFIWLGDNKFIVIYQKFNERTTLIINTYKIEENKKIVKIADKTVTTDDLFKRYPKFSYDNYIVLNPETVIFSSGMNGAFQTFKVTNKTYVYNCFENSLKQAGNFPYKTIDVNFFKLDDYTLLAYGSKIYTVFTKVPNKGIKDNSIYIFKLRKTD